MKNVKDLSNKANREEALDNVADRLSNLKREIESAAHDAGRNIADYYADKKSELIDLSDQYAAQVRRKPIQTSLIALGVGYLLGRLFK